MKIWTQITQDTNGRYVAKDVFKAISFLTAVVLFIASAIGCWWGKDITIQGAIALLLMAFGIQVNKDWASIAHRKVEVEAGCDSPSSPSDSESPKPDTDPGKAG